MILIFRHVVYDGQREIARLLVERKRKYWQKQRSSEEKSSAIVKYWASNL